MRLARLPDACLAGSQIVQPLFQMSRVISIILILFYFTGAPELLGRYDMDRGPRGKCVIINNVNFQDKSYNRVGAEHDERELVKLFKELQFEVEVKNDLKWDQMRNVAVEYAKIDHSHFAAFVMILMSHGDNLDKIFGVHLRTIGVEDIITEFKALNCPTLEGKPKLFFINACRGSLEESQSSSTYRRGACTDKCILGDSTLPRSTCPQETDFLLAFSAAPGYQSYRFQEYGSLFIQVSYMNSEDVYRLNG